MDNEHMHTELVALIEHMERDSAKHSCDPVSWAEYRERIRQADNEQVAA